jgi:hypothetical protein
VPRVLGDAPSDLEERRRALCTLGERHDLGLGRRRGVRPERVERVDVEVEVGDADGSALCARATPPRVESMGDLRGADAF